MADANYGLPLAQITTTAKRNDSPWLPAVMDKARAALPWLQPTAAIADRGYDAASNHHYLDRQGVLPVILIRQTAKRGLVDGIYQKDGTPTCLGKVSMEYVRTDPVKGRLYRCRTGGCHLLGSRGGVKYCDDEVWEDPRGNIRLFGVLRRDSPGVEGAVRQAPDHRAHLQEHETEPPAGAPLYQGAPHDPASCPDVHAGLPGDRAGRRPGRGAGHDALDGLEGGVGTA